MKRVSHPAKAFFDVAGAFAHFIQEYACQNLQQMGRILVPVSSGDAELFLLYCFSDEGSYPAGRYVHQGCFLSAVASNGHAVRLLQSPGLEDHPPRAFDRQTLSNASMIVYPFCQFFLIRQVIRSESAVSEEELSVILSWHFAASKKVKSSARL